MEKDISMKNVQNAMGMENLAAVLTQERNVVQNAIVEDIINVGQRLIAL